MHRFPKLVEITPEGKIVGALVEGAKGYGELKSATRLSDRWLSKKLKELSSTGLVEQREGRYRLKDPTEIIDIDPVFAEFLRRKPSLKMKARLIADEIGNNAQIVAVVLFGSVAKRKASDESDIDLLIVAEVEMEDSLNITVYNLMFKYDAPVEAIFLTYEDLLVNLQSKTAFSFGLLEGYEVLYDRGGVETLLSIKRKKMLDDWEYDEEAGAWFQKRLTPTLKPVKTS